jgi:tRNA A-37 threonylcarbamoyl transferase component Bud32
MTNFRKESLQEYLSQLYKTLVQNLQVTEIGKETSDGKSFGYGKPLLVRFSIGDKQVALVLETMKENSFGHDHFSDRAQNLLWANSTFNKMPGHVRALDTGGITPDGLLFSAGTAEEFFLITEFVAGETYYKDLERVYRTGELTKLDELRAAALAKYLAQIHEVKHNSPQLYTRRIRDLIGHGECIMGLIDNYPSDQSTNKLLQEIEEECVRWRWKIKDKAHRLCQVHGDFHPWNILFRKETDFTVLDRSRGEWGEPADDLASMSINYIFLSLQRYGSLRDPFQQLFSTFWNTYFESMHDKEMIQVIQPFLAWRGLVIANPVWYSALSTEIRRTIFRFIQNVLSVSAFNANDVNSYLE